MHFAEQAAGKDAEEELNADSAPNEGEPNEQERKGIALREQHFGEVREEPQTEALRVEENGEIEDSQNQEESGVEERHEGGFEGSD